MLNIKKYYLICLLLLLPSIGICQTEVDLSISQLRSGDPIVVQSAKDYIIRRWVYIFATEPDQYFPKRFKKELIQIINEDTTIPDTIMDHDRVAQEPVHKSEQ